MLAKNSGKLTFQTAYTLSWTYNQFAELNDGIPFPAYNDIRNNISTYFNYRLNKKFEFGFVFVYMTGKPVTLPINSYFFPGMFYYKSINFQTNVPIYAQTERNAYRMKPYNRVDLSFKWNIPGKNNRYRSSIAIDIYNVYNRKNPYYYYLDLEDVFDESNTVEIGQKVVLKSVSLFPIIPSISYNFKF